MNKTQTRIAAVLLSTVVLREGLLARSCYQSRTEYEPGVPSGVIDFPGPCFTAIARVGSHTVTSKLLSVPRHNT